MKRPMSASGPKQTSLAAPHMSAFGGKADMTKRKHPLLQSQLGVKRTWVSPQMSAWGRKVLAFKYCTRRGPYGGHMQRRDFITFLGGAASAA